MKIKIVFALILFLLVIGTSTANLESYTVVGKITDSSGKPLYNAEIVLHSSVDSCECANEIPDYTSSTGIYSSSVDNLVLIQNCNNLMKGMPCAALINENSDKVWIVVKGYSVLPKPYGDAESQKLIWASYDKKGTVYSGLNLALPNLEKAKEKEVSEERRTYESFWMTPGIVSIVNKSIANPEIDVVEVSFTKNELVDILGKDIAQQVINNMLAAKTKPKTIDLYFQFGWIILFIAFLVLIVLFFAGLKERKNK